MDYSRFTSSDLADGIGQTEAMISKLEQILEDLKKMPETEGFRAQAEGTKNSLQILQKDLVALKRAYAADKGYA